MKNIIRICNLMVGFSKFTLIKIYEEFVEFLSKLVWRETLFGKKKKKNEEKEEEGNTTFINTFQFSFQ